MTDGTGIESLDTLVIWVGALTVIGGAVAFLWRGTRGIRRVARRFDEFADDWQGTESRPGVPARAGVMSRLARFEVSLVSLHDRIGAVEHELHPNSGSSLRDAVDRVERCVSQDGDGAPGALRTA